MSDPQRLLDDPSLLALDRDVLRSALGDAPTDRARAATRAAIGLGVLLPAAAASVHAAGAAGGGGAGGAITSSAGAGSIAGAGSAASIGATAASAGGASLAGAAATSGAGIATGGAGIAAGMAGGVAAKVGLALALAGAVAAVGVAGSVDRPVRTDAVSVASGASTGPRAQPMKPAIPSLPTPRAGSRATEESGAASHESLAIVESTAMPTHASRGVAPRHGPSVEDHARFGTQAAASPPPAALAASSAGATPTAASEGGGQAARFGAEIAALDHARVALRDGDARGALREIAAYDAAFPSGEFAREATIVRVDALLAVGERAAAQRVARVYVERYPSSPAAPRLRRLVEEPASAPGE